MKQTQPSVEHEIRTVLENDPKLRKYLLQGFEPFAVVPTSVFLDNNKIYLRRKILIES